MSTASIPAVGYDAYTVVQQSVHQSVPEFVQAASAMAGRRPASEKGIDEVIRRLADQDRQEAWESVKDDLDRLIRAESTAPRPSAPKR